MARRISVMTRIITGAIAVAILVLVGLGQTDCFGVGAEVPAAGPAFLARFDSDDWPQAVLPGVVREPAGQWVADGVAGGALGLGPGECLGLEASRVVGASGTAMFWLRPHWGYYATRDGEMLSHTLLSFRWSDGGYFVLSDGWWEQARGMYQTRFVANNLSLLNVGAPIRFREGQWVHVAVTWQAGTPGRIQLYVNGALAAERSGPLALQASTGTLHVGCDQGTPLAAGRWADSDFDELALYPRALSGDEIQQELAYQDPAWRERASAWLRVALAAPAAPQARDAGNRLLESRAIFDEGPAAWRDPAAASALVARLKAAGFNVYIPCVWHGDGTRYPSPVAPPAPYMGPGDPLAELIRVAHASGIQVHPWFTVALRPGDLLPEFVDGGTPRQAFELLRPAFRDFMVTMILDVVRRYDVDGINLDYIRTMGRTRSHYAREQYRLRFGRELLADIPVSNPRGALEPHLQAFLDEAVEDIVRRVSQGARQLKPDLVISVDGHPVPAFFPPSNEGRQEIRWANAGLIDVIYSMNYEADLDLDGIELAAARLIDPDRLRVIVGNFDRVDGATVARGPQALADLVEVVRRRWGRGVAVYPYSLLTFPHVRALARGPLREPALPSWPAPGGSDGITLHPAALPGDTP